MMVLGRRCTGVQLVTVKIPEALLREVNRLIDAGIFMTKSEALRCGLLLLVILYNRGISNDRDVSEDARRVIQQITGICGGDEDK